MLGILKAAVAALCAFTAIGVDNKMQAKHNNPLRRVDMLEF